jgi:molybdopterin-synthase adenylyltransferase
MPQIHWTYNKLGISSAKLSKICILIAGVGGNGSFAAEALVRLGFRKFILSDFDIVEPRNIGRQDYTKADLGQPKVNALTLRLKSITPNIRVIPVKEGITEQNCKNLVEKASIVIDAMDNYRMKVLLSRLTKQLQIPKIHSSGAGYKGSVTVFMPGRIDYENMFMLPSVGRILAEVAEDEFVAHRMRVASIVGQDMYDSEVVNAIGTGGVWPTLVTPCMCAGTIAAFEAFKIVQGDLENVIMAPQILEFDLLRNVYKVRKVHHCGEKE